MTVHGQLQEGIYHASGTRPGKFFAILCLLVGDRLGAREVGESFSIL